MIKRIAVAVTALLLSATMLVSCTSDRISILTMGDASVDSVEISTDGNAVLFSSDDNSISEALFKYLYLYFKDSLLLQAAYYEAMGYNITGSEDIKVADTEAFWGCVLQENTDGTVVTMKDYVYDSTLSVLKDVLAMEAASKDYKFVYPDDYQSDLEEAIYSDVEENGSNYLNEDEEFADENGVVYDWVKARREVYLASKGITAEEWERVFFLYKDIFAENITSHLESVGAIASDDEDILKQEIREELEKQLESFLEDDIKIDILYYEYKTEDDSEEFSSNDLSDDSNDNTSDDISDDTSDVTSDDTSNDTISAEEYNKNLLQACNDTLEALINGERTVEDELNDTAHGESDAVVTKESVANFFGDAAAECKPGDIKLYDTEYCIYILVYKELTADDFGRTTEPTEDEMTSAKENSLSEKLDSFLNRYIEQISVNEDVLEKYNRPWEIK